MSSLGREGAARPKDRLPRAPQLVMAPQLAVVQQPVVPHVEEPSSQNLSEDATGQSVGASDDSADRSRPVHSCIRPGACQSPASQNHRSPLPHRHRNGALGLVLFRMRREAARYYSLLRPAATAPHGTSVSKREGIRLILRPDRVRHRRRRLRTQRLSSPALTRRLNRSHGSSAMSSNPSSRNPSSRNPSRSLSTALVRKKSTAHPLGRNSSLRATWRPRGTCWNAQHRHVMLASLSCLGRPMTQTA